jgi:excisionase family DNA binding protein
MTMKMQPLTPGDASQPERLYTYAAIAELAEVSERRVRRWVEEGKLAYVQLPRGRRITLRQYLDFISERAVEKVA